MEINDYYKLSRAAAAVLTVIVLFVGSYTEIDSNESTSFIYMLFFVCPFAWLAFTAIIEYVAERLNW